MDNEAAAGGGGDDQNPSLFGIFINEGCEMTRIGSTETFDVSTRALRKALFKT